MSVCARHVMKFKGMYVFSGCSVALVTDVSADPVFQQRPWFVNLLCRLQVEYTAAASAAADKQGEINDQPIFTMQT